MIDLERAGAPADGADDEAVDVEFAVQLQRILGPEVMALFDHPHTSELYVNQDGSVWTVARGMGHHPSGHTLPSSTVEGFLNVAAARLGKVITPASPSLHGELPRPVFGGARLQGILPPISEGPVFHARKRPRLEDVVPLEAYRDDGTMARRHYDVLHEAVVRGESIMVGGQVNSGKSYLLNALIDHQVRHLENPFLPIFIVEDTVEIVCTAPNRTNLRTTPEWGFDFLLYLALRCNAAILHLNEVRAGFVHRGPGQASSASAGSALQLIEMWSSGARGYCTVHGEDAEGVLGRVNGLATRESGRDEGTNVAKAVQLVVMINTCPQRGRRVHEVARVLGYERGRFELQSL